jgi:hypothetical protein
MMKLLEGAVIPEGDESEDVEALHDEIHQLRDDLSAARRETSQAKRESARALAALRKQLSPLYQALQMVFGELDALPADEPVAQTVSRSAWDEWKQRLGPSCAKVIDTLLLGGEMTITSICVAAKIGKRTAYTATSKMGQAGILLRNGGKFSLKKL